MTTDAENWINGVRAGILAATVVHGAEKAAQAAILMAPITVSRGLVLCGMTEISQLEAAVGRRIFLDCSLPAGEYLVIDGERYAKSTV